MDRNTIIGFLLIFAILIAWQQYNKPPAEVLEAEARRQDSLVQLHQDSLELLQQGDKPAEPSSVAPKEEGREMSLMEDSLKHLVYGPFARAAEGEEQIFELKNDQLRITFTNKGGRILSAQLLNYQRVVVGEKHQEHKEPLFLLNDPKNQFAYEWQLPNTAKGVVSTADLYFEAQQEGRSLIFRLYSSDGAYFEQKYTLAEHGFDVYYELRWKGLERVLAPSQKELPLYWSNYLNKLEKSTRYEKNYSTIYYRPLGEDPVHLSFMKDDRKSSDGKPLEWVAHTNQFFQTTLMGQAEPFQNGEFAVEVLPIEAENLKKCETRLSIPFAGRSSFAMQWYIGPNDFDRLAAYDRDLEYTIAYGSSILGTINRWIIRPIFKFFSSWIGSMGLTIFLLTFIVKLSLYPLAYKMLYQQSKMAALKPQLEKIKERFKDEPQQQQAETMKLYQEYGVNPLGGCLPTLLQMPIWIALYRFFPAAIEFRQKSFLWATDLSSYDVAFSLPFTIPAYGDHVSLFTVLWAGTTVIYTYYNSKHMDMSSNPAMKYMQYFMPIMFLFFFNNYASGLTVYLLFSNLLNIAQTLITKNYIIDQDKIRKELEAAKAKPKKKGGFRERLQKALEEQQRLAEQQKKKKK